MSDPDVTESWTRIVDWLGRNAPATGWRIAAPAGAAALREAEAAFPAPWPGDLRAWYSLQNGAPMDELWKCVLPMSEVLSLERMAETRTLMSATHPDDADEIAQAPHANDNAFAFLPHYVPIGDDGCGSTLYVDLRPGEHHGCVGDYDGGSGDSDTADPSWASVGAMLADVADCLDSGQPILGWLVPSVEDGELSWVDVEETA